MTFETWFRQLAPTVPTQSMLAVLELKSEGATLPFIARYRKEKTGNLDEVQIQKVIDLKEEWDEILNRQGYILGEIEKQGKLTDELKSKISTTFDKNLLEDFSDSRLDLRPSCLDNTDIIGNSYEYLISHFASDAGKKGGEFFHAASW